MYVAAFILIFLIGWLVQPTPIFPPCERRDEVRFDRSDSDTHGRLEPTRSSECFLSEKEGLR